MKGFAIERAVVGSRTSTAIVATCSMQKIPYVIIDNPVDIPFGFTPYGNVNWVETILGSKIKPEYFPAFAKKLINRKIWQQNEWPTNGVHVKPADEYKRYQGRMADGTVEVGPHFCSEQVDILNEWRYYVANGKILAAWWYLGNEECDAPMLDVNIPEKWCGTLDIGQTNNGLILIEAHHPFSCGWYGEIYKAEAYLEWLSKGWEYMKILSERN